MHDYKDLIFLFLSKAVNTKNTKRLKIIVIKIAVLQQPDTRRVAYVMQFSHLKLPCQCKTTIYLLLTICKFIRIVTLHFFYKISKKKS